VHTDVAEVYVTELVQGISKGINDGCEHVVVKRVANPDWVRIGYRKNLTVTHTPVRV
jgi:hypothetical protein